MLDSEGTTISRMTQRTLDLLCSLVGGTISLSNLGCELAMRPGFVMFEGEFQLIMCSNQMGSALGASFGQADKAGQLFYQEQLVHVLRGTTTSLPAMCPLPSKLCTGQ